MGGLSAVDAVVRRVDGGGFVAVASDGGLDRDGERIAPGALSPLPASVPVHLDHTMTAATVVARAVPSYQGDRLVIDAVFASTEDAQQVRQKVADGVIDSLSVVFRALRWEQRDGIRTLVKGELLAVDLVTVPSNPRAQVLSYRALSGADPVAQARAVAWDALRSMALAEVKDARRYLAATTRPGWRADVDQLLAELADPPPSARSTVHAFLRSL